MPRPDQLIRAAVTLPVGFARWAVGIAWGLVPGTGGDERPEPEATDVEVAIAADDAMTRAREPVEETAVLPDDDLGGHVEPEVEVVAESADAEATDAPGPDIHIEDRR